jgi:hypothetical protein
VRHDDNRIPGLELIDQLFDALRGDRVERRRRLVHENDVRLDRERARDAESLLLAARQRQRRGVEAILDLVPERRGFQAGLDASAQLAAGGEHIVDPQTVGHVLEN